MVNPYPRGTTRPKPETTTSEWKTKSLGEAATSDGVVWRSQISKAPDRRRFIGVRKFAVKKDGTEVVTRDGITLAMTDEGKVPVATLRAIIDLLGGFLPENRKAPAKLHKK